LDTGFRLVLAFGLPLVGALALTPVAAGVAHRTGVISRPRSDRFHLTATPYLGGVAIAGSLLLGSALTAGPEGEVIVIMLGAVVLALVGLVDDIRGVGPLVRVGIEAVLGVALWAEGIRSGLFGVPALDLLLTVAWVIAVTNAVNILDNMDGVATGVAAISAVGLAAIAWTQGEILVTPFALAIAGGCLGFLPYNFPPARIFLGDAGSLFLGFLLAAVTLKLDLVEPPGLARGVVPALALAVPLFDMALVTIARLTGGRPVHRGGLDHTAHRLHARGLHRRSIALLAYSAQAACSALALFIARGTTGLAQTSLVLTVATAAAALALLLRIHSGELIEAQEVGRARLWPSR